MGVLLLVSAAGLFDAAALPEGRALAFLSREVPSWSVENKCFSCHNNGDGARVLFVAVKLGRPVPAKSLADTLAWLQQPDKWDHNGGDTPNKDKVLSRIQFAAALVEAAEAGLIKDKDALARAAKRVAEDQQKDGSWQLENDGLGSPATYGRALATHMARRVLQKADAQRHRDAIDRAGQWLRTVEVQTVLDAAAVLWGMEGDGEAAEQRKKCLEIIRKGRSQDGGWGPYVTSQSESFDTAVVVLALNSHRDQEGVRGLIAGGRKFLLSRQTEEGNWPETTRPAGSDSYALRLSTTGWVVQALGVTGQP